MSKILTSFDGRASMVKQVALANEGKAPSEATFAKIATDQKDVKAEDKNPIMSSELMKENILIDMRDAIKQVDTLRKGSKDRRAVDMDWGVFVKEKWGFSASTNGQPDSFYQALGINPGYHTMDSLMTMPDFNDGFRWLIPEVIREAVRLGLRKSPIYPNLIAAEENVSQPTVVMPFINMSDAMPKKIGEAETIPTGTVSFGQKNVQLQKVGTGIKMTDEVQQFVSLNILSLYLEDVGVKLNLALDSMLINVLINGDGGTNSNACPVIGVESSGIWSYKDLLRAWIRMGLLGRLPQSMLSNETPALDILMLPEFRGYGTGIGAVSGNQTPSVAKINLRTPVPTNQSYDIHGAMPVSNQVMLIDATSAAIKLNATALRVESDRIAERQINGTYISLTTGFAKLFQDATLIIDNSLAYSANGFPSWMSPLSYQNQSFKTI